jgi:hypothetical protein
MVWEEFISWSHCEQAQSGCRWSIPITATVPPAAAPPEAGGFAYLLALCAFCHSSMEYSTFSPGKTSDFPVMAKG